MMNSFLTMFLILVLSGCDLLKTDVVKKPLDSSQFSADCALDDKAIDRFSKILTENISQEIRCLGENLNLFIRVVESDRPGYMQRAALEAYLKNNEPDIGPEVISALRSIYDLNYLLTGDNREYISQANVNKLIRFAIAFNSEMSLTITPLFSSKRKISFKVHEAQRKFIKDSGIRIVDELNKVYNQNAGNGKRELNIVNLLESFSTDATQDDIEKIIKVLFVKKILLGGEREILTHDEVKTHFLLNFNKIVESTYDIVKFRYVKDFTQETIFSILEENVGRLGGIISNPLFGNRDKELFFSVQEAMDVAELFIDDPDFDIQDWKTLFLEAKKVFMGGNEQNVLGLDFKTLVNHANNVLKTGTTFYDIYSNPKLKPALESPEPVKVDFSEYKHVYHDALDELDNFERIVKKYRFFRGKFEAAYHTKGIRRNPDGMVEIYMFEYALRLVMKVHGQPDTTSLGGYGITQAGLLKLVTTLEKTLIKLKLIMPLRKDSLVDNISLLGTLFQYQSDKNGLLDANEGTEFVVALLTTMDMTKNMTAYYKLKGCQFDEFERVEPECFKQHFFKSMCEPFDDGTEDTYREGYRKYFPLLFESIGAKSCDEIQNSEADLSFLDVSIRAARGCMNYSNTDGTPGEEIYYSEGDIYSTLMVMLHAEATTLRWDDVNNKGNGNNFMDAPEVDRAYEIYSPALDGFLASQPSILKALKKQIYQYLIKYETVPNEKEFSSIWKFIKFLVSFKKQAPAYRRTLAAILSEIGKQNAKTAEQAGKPKFQCNWLRDPDNIPETIPPMSSQPLIESQGYSSLLNYIHRSGEIDVEGEPVFRNDKELCLKLFNKRICL